MLEGFPILQGVGVWDFLPFYFMYHVSALNQHFAKISINERYDLGKNQISNKFVSTLDNLSSLLQSTSPLLHSMVQACAS